MPPGWSQSLPGWKYEYPRDHAIHPDFKTEWWYFTGNLKDDSGRSFGYELTFFRQGMLPPGQRDELAQISPTPGRFVQNDFKFAHFAVSDLTSGKFYYNEKINRGAFGDAGFEGIPQPASNARPADLSQRLAWIENWSLTSQPDGSWNLTAVTGGETPMTIRLRVSSTKPPVVHGIDGVSQKAEGAGNASHYYSFTRLQTSGVLALGKGDAPHAVTGESWFDHEWASNQLGVDQVGWDWFSLQFNDGTELMLYAMRRRDGTTDAVSGGTWVQPDGRAEHLGRQDFQMAATRTWKSSLTGAVYPVEWRMNIPTRQLSFALKPRLDTQELALPLISYWEGAVAAEGQRAGQPVKATGYMELTGYAGALKGLQGEKNAASSGLARAVR